MDVKFKKSYTRQFFNEIEHYMGIPILAATAKRKLSTVIMKFGELVNKYYY